MNVPYRTVLLLSMVVLASPAPAVTGIRQLNVCMREDGLVIDRVLLTTNAGYTPSGAGPAQSPR